MEFVLSLASESERRLQSAVEALCHGSLGALDRAAGETEIVDRRIVAALADAGLLDWGVPGAYGTGRSHPPAPPAMSLVAFCLVRETLARHCPNAELIFK